LRNVSFKNANLTRASIYAPGDQTDRDKKDEKEWDYSIKTVDFSDAVINGFRCISYDNEIEILMSWSQLYSTLSYKNKDLRNFYLSNLEYNHTRSDHLDFSGFNLAGADFSNTWYMNQDWHFGRVTLTDADITDVIFQKYHRIFGHGVLRTRKTDIGYCIITPQHNLTFAQFKSTKNYQYGDLRDFCFSGGDLSDWDFSGMNLTGTIFKGGRDQSLKDTNLNLTNTNFTNAVITNASFGDDIDGLTPEQIKSTWNYQNGHMNGVRLPRHIQEVLGLEKFDPFDNIFRY